MGEGEEALGKTLLKGFIFSLTQQDALPKTILFYNSFGGFLVSSVFVTSSACSAAEHI